MEGTRELRGSYVGMEGTWKLRGNGVNYVQVTCKASRLSSRDCVHSVAALRAAALGSLAEVVVAHVGLLACRDGGHSVALQLRGNDNGRFVDVSWKLRGSYVGSYVGSTWSLRGTGKWSLRGTWSLRGIYTGFTCK